MLNRFFVYGTLMRDLPNHHLLRPYAQSITEAFLPEAELYHLPYGYPAVRLVKGAADVRGEAVEVADAAAVLPLLDELEDFFGEGHPKNLYDRKIARIRLSDWNETEAYIYVWSRPEKLPLIGQKVEDGCWRSYLEERH